MAVNLIALVSLVLGIYVLKKADKKKKSSEFKLTYAISGIVLLVWSLGMLFGTYSASMGMMPLFFGLATIGTLESKGWTQVTFGALALFVLFNIWV